MSDPAHEETEKIIKSLERQITKEYRRAEKEMQAKLNGYLKRFETKEKIWQGWVKQGKKSAKDYAEWRTGQIAIGRSWKNQIDILANDISRANQMARNIVAKRMPDVYAENHNYGVYEIEHGTGIDTYYGLYDHDTVEELFTDGKVYHDPGWTTLGKIAEGKEMRWNKSNIQSAMLQGILQGESIPKIATRISDTVGEKNRKAAIRNARTIATGVQNKGRIDSYERANRMGIDTRKQWLATLDGRTRHSHRMVDGEIVDPNKKFSNGCRYPGDPDGPASEIYNCRCTLIAAIKGFEHDLSDTNDRNTNKLKNMSYEEWKKSKPKYQDILHQEKLGKAMKDLYSGEYKGLYFLKNAGTNGNIRYRIGQPVEPTPITYEMALNKKLHAETITNKYGMNLKVNGRPVEISIDKDAVNPGKVTKENPYVITLGPSAFDSEEELAVTIAHELNHCRSFARGGDAPEAMAYDAEERLRQYIRGKI